MTFGQFLGKRITNASIIAGLLVALGVFCLMLVQIVFNMVSPALTPALARYENLTPETVLFIKQVVAGGLVVLGIFVLAMLAPTTSQGSTNMDEQDSVLPDTTIYTDVWVVEVDYVDGVGDASRIQRTTLIGANVAYKAKGGAIQIDMTHSNGNDGDTLMVPVVRVVKVFIREATEAEVTAYRASRVTAA